MRLTIQGDLVTPDTIYPNGALTIDDAGRIAQISARAAGTPDYDARGLLVLPGFLDMHVHGGGGADFMRGTPDAVRKTARTHARFGTTGLLATTLTANRADIDAALLAITDVCRAPGAGEARILGIHLEGPYICAHKRGAQPLAPIRPPDVSELARWMTLTRGAIKQITLAPEMPGAPALIAHAAREKIVASIGHTDATYEQAMAGIRSGATQATHLFNAMRGLGHREPGTVGALLSDPSVFVELICDAVHLHPSVIKIAVAAKGADRVLLITDAIEGAAMPDGVYALGGISVRVSDGTASFDDGTLAGSVLTMNRAFLNVQSFAGVGPVVASRMASQNPARQIGVSETKGSLEVGKDADLVVLDPATGDVHATIVQGRFVYRR